MRLVMAALVIEHNTFGIQCAQVAGCCKQDVVEHLKRLFRAFTHQQGPRKRNRRIDIVRSLLQRIAQSLLVSILTEGLRDALAQSWIDLLGPNQFCRRDRLL
ncbi:hypothetical protein XF30_10165 [Bradyrhizobium sp. SUTN9-2]|nr:hypothetical protein XF30_10165 [Bradyrhizobium sp. SUTN9-2]